MFQKSMKDVLVSTNDDKGLLTLEQDDPDPEAPSYRHIELSFAQVPIVAQWMLEAAAGGSVEGAARPSLTELRSHAHLFRRLEAAAAGGPQDRGSPIEAIRVALEWASGESDLSPDAWLNDEKAHSR